MLPATQAPAAVATNAARMLAGENPGNAHADVLVWAEALCATVESHTGESSNQIVQIPNTTPRET